MKSKIKIGIGILGILFLAFSFTVWGVPPSEEPLVYQSVDTTIVDRASGCEYQSNSEYSGELGAVYQECNKGWEQREYVRLKYINDDATNYPKEIESEIMVWNGQQLI